MIISKSGHRTRSWRWRNGTKMQKPRYDWSKKTKRRKGWVA